MNKLFSVYGKEMRSYFHSPVAYGAILVFLLFTGVMFLFFGQFLASNTASLRSYFGLFPLVFMVLIPALTMRSWADEKRLGSQELLLTLPVKVGHLVLGKFAAAYTVVAVMVLLTLPMTWMVLSLGQFEGGEIWGEYIGILAMAGAATAIGVLVSSLTSHNILAFLLGAVILFVLTLAYDFVNTFNLPEYLSGFVRFFSLKARFDSFEKGIIDSRDLGFFLWTAALTLYLNTKVLILRKWR